MWARNPERSLAVCNTVSRRSFLRHFGMGLGAVALADLMNPVGAQAATDGVLKKLHHAPKAKRVILLFQVGAPSQIDWFDYKPVLNEMHGQRLPDEVRQGQLTGGDFGRDHHPRCFTMWMAGGGVKGGMCHGVTDPYCYNIAESPVHVHGFQATLLHLLGIDHERLTFKYQGRRFRLTDVHGHVIHDVIA